MSKNLKHSSKKLKEINFSRRKILSFFMMIPFVGMGLCKSKEASTAQYDDFVLINGWVLKKKDLHAV
ncbi:hypothetical protein PF327_09340 [Sulfurovum sp. XTW-4]|uniref:Uncharacterized protein n=1 Tax=Sulfurovum xiamenensis TaxID=3019066 RepID=A0ABT7QTK5_9BACT|nr:hypothetical protein [Sulfurovum xiamenensis]MDM5264398.1 hypothetical protein [Sulfurovum xiamenensis]